MDRLESLSYHKDASRKVCRNEWEEGLISQLPLMLQGVPTDTVVERAGGRMVLSLFTFSVAPMCLHTSTRGLDFTVVCACGLASPKLCNATTSVFHWRTDTTVRLCETAGRSYVILACRGCLHISV